MKRKIDRFERVFTFVTRAALVVFGALLRAVGIGAVLRRLALRTRLNLTPIPRLSERRRHPLQILIYHRVVPEPDPFAIDAISIKDFERQIRTLKSCFRIVSLSQAAEAVRRNKLAPGMVCITFDDGYRDNFDHAFPILKKYEVPATVFLTTDFIGNGREIWHDQVLRIFEHTAVRHPNLAAFGIQKADLSSIRGRRATAHRVLEWLKRLTPEEQALRIRELEERLGEPGPRIERLMLNWDEIEIMHGAGIEFGAHTKSHAILARLSEERIRREILGSKEAIEQRLGQEVMTFAYPNGGRGDFDSRARKVLAENGFLCAVTTICGFVHENTDLFAWPRCSPWERHPLRFPARLVLERWLDGD